MNNHFDPDASGLDIARCVIVNQVEERSLTSADIWAASLRSKGATVINAVERGLSKSRNRAIAAATEDICIIADDDLVFDEDASERIESIFNDNPDVDVITFQARDENGRLLRRYRAESYRHTILTAPSILSVEIVFRRPSVLKSKVFFDERFGLGSEFVSGEENIFIADLIRSGLTVMYFPICIVSHHGATSGGQFQHDDVIISKGAVIRRMLGKFSFPILILFSLKKSIQHRINPLRFIMLAIKGYHKL